MHQDPEHHGYQPTVEALVRDCQSHTGSVARNLRLLTSILVSRHRQNIDEVYRQLISSILMSTLMSTLMSIHIQSEGLLLKLACVTAVRVGSLFEGLSPTRQHTNHRFVGWASAFRVCLHHQDVISNVCGPQALGIPQKDRIKQAAC